MGMERRGCVDQSYLVVNQEREEPLGKEGQELRLIDGSRMSREVHVRVWEGAGVRFPPATRLKIMIAAHR